MTASTHQGALTAAQLAESMNRRMPGQPGVPKSARGIEKLMDGIEPGIVERDAAGYWRLTASAEEDIGVALRSLGALGDPDPAQGVHRRRRKTTP